MARNLITLESSGLKEFIKELTGIEEHFLEISEKALRAQQQVVLDKMRINWVTIVGGSSGGFVASSMGQSSKPSEKNPNGVVGTVGVYNIDTIAASFGKTNRGVSRTGKKRADLNAAQIAYWVEFGSQRLKTNKRKVKGYKYDDEFLATAVVGKPFMTQALYSTFDEQYEAFKAEFNRLADEQRK